MRTLVTGTSKSPASMLRDRMEMQGISFFRHNNEAIETRATNGTGFYSACLAECWIGA